MPRRRRHRNAINPNARGHRTGLRILGFVLVGVGGTFAAVAFVDIFSTFGSHSAFPTKAWCLFVGIPLLGVGLTLLKLAYLGPVTRYVAGEFAPVAKDTINYLGEESARGIDSMAKAAGLRTAAANEIACPSCGHDNDHDARFCDDCGAALESSKTCPSCATENDRDAKFCDHCGAGF